MWECEFVKARAYEGICRKNRTYYTFFSNSRLRFYKKIKRQVRRKAPTIEDYLKALGLSTSDFDECITINQGYPLDKKLREKE